MTHAQQNKCEQVYYRVKEHNNTYSVKTGMFDEINLLLISPL